jgi:putative flavoprotein involved in K+ transport
MSSSAPLTSVQNWLNHFSTALADRDIGGACDLFAPTACWRDLLAFSWNIVTAEGVEQIRNLLDATLAEVRPCNWVVTGEPETVDADVVGWLSFQTAAGTGKARVVLGDGRCKLLFTTLRDLHGYAEKTAANRNREHGVEHGAKKNRRSWLDRKRASEAALGDTEQPYCLIVGGGQGGLGLAARLKRLNVPTIVVEQNPRAGDSWRNRYRTLCLHDPVWYDHMPYIPFPEHWPVFSPKDKLGDWLEMYAKVMEIDFWGSTRCMGAAYDASAQRWTVQLEHDGKDLSVQPAHLILATGMSGYPKVPEIPGAEDFAGEMMHSSQYRSGEAYAAKRCVVVGSNTSGHDICADLWESGAHVTMVQRSPTIVVRSGTMSTMFWDALYSEEAVAQGIDTDTADLIAAATPFKLAPERFIRANKKIREMDRDLYEGLDSIGFQYDFGEDGSGIGGAYVRRGGGYYIEVGASALLIEGKIALKSRANIERVKEDGLVLDDGSFLPADLIVFATGYGNMNEWAQTLISGDVAQRVGRCWGLGSGAKGDPGPWEGELRNMWKPTHQPGLWFHGGNLMQSRFYSRSLSLQLKARYEGVPTPVYGMPPVHHVE